MLRNKNALFYIIGCVMYGTNGLLVNHIPMKSYEIAVLRSIFGSAFLLVLFLAAGGRFTFTKHKKQFACLAASSVIMGTSGILLYEAFSQIGVSVSTLLYYCGPVVVILLSPILFKEKLTWVKLASIAVIFAGIILVNGLATGGSYSEWGLLCGAMSAVCWAFMVILNKKVTDIRGLEKATLQICISLVPTGLFAIMKQGWYLPVPAQAWPYVLVLGAINTGLGSYFYFSSMGNLPVQTASTLGYLEPLTAVIAGVAVLHEPMNAYQIIGAAMVLGGALLSELKTPPRD